VGGLQANGGEENIRGDDVPDTEDEKHWRHYEERKRKREVMEWNQSHRVFPIKLSGSRPRLEDE